MPVTLKYDTEACGRCGGSGNYSYCSMYGTRCFKCAGRKWTLTRAGAKASAAVAAFIKDNFSVKVRDLKPGDRIKYDGVTRTVVSVSFDGHCGSSNGVLYESWTLTVNKPIKSAFGAYSSIGMSGDTMIVKAVSGADWDAVVAFARTIKKGVSMVDAPAPVAVAS